MPQLRRYISYSRLLHKVIWSLLSGVLLIYVFCLVSCTSESSDRMFVLVPPESSGVFFSNDITDTDSLIAQSFEYLFNGGGVGVGDFNNDGLEDLYFTSNMGTNRLYINRGNLQFDDVTERAGLLTNDKWSSGATIGDINQDGYLDIYVSVGGLSTDLDQRANLLYINQGDGTFINKAEEYGLADSGYSIHAGLLDYDKDGDQDLYLLTTELDPYSWTEFRPRRVSGEASNTDRLYRNNGDQTFTNVSDQAGILIEGYGLGMAFCDINADGWTDIYVANDFLSNDVIYVNQQDGTFADSIALYLDHTSRNSMGVDLADFNNDGLTDIMVVDMLPVSNRRQKSMFGFFNYDKFKLGLDRGYLPQYARNTLQMNLGNGIFSEVGQLADVDQTDWSWATLFADFDNDGWQDLLITNGYRQDITNMDFATYSRQLASSPIGSEDAKEEQMLEQLKALDEIKVPNYIFRNSGSLPFKDVSKEWGFEKPSYSNGAAYVDLDLDGDLEIVINNIDAPAFIYENKLYAVSDEETDNNYLRIKLSARSVDQLNARVTISVGGQKQVRHNNPYRGYLSTVESTLHFGLGGARVVDEIKVVWSDGAISTINEAAVNQVLTIDHSSADKTTSERAYHESVLIDEVTEDLLDRGWTHEEDDFADFKMQPILPHKHSQNGPGLAVGDIDGDGLDDFYVGGSDDHGGGAFLQSEGGHFTQVKLNLDTSIEQMGLLLLDADGDGDQDIYVANGGSTATSYDHQYPDQFYVNEGGGVFVQSSTAIPEITSSGGVVTGADFDKDGDIDLFVGGRVRPGSYPLSPQSYLLENVSTTTMPKFKDVTPDVLSTPGMVTSALWTDYDGDGWQDLLVCGEFMPITYFKNFEGVLGKQKLELEHSAGWWNSIQGADFDKDGDIDYIAGNLGLNTRFRDVSPDEPLSLYAKDFDKNGLIDPVMSYYIDGGHHIIPSRDMLIKQISAMRLRFKTYQSYGESTLERSFTKEELSDALKLISQSFASVYIENLGDGTFNLSQLPIEAQVAPIYGIITDDVNGDGHLDVLLTGNSLATQTSIGQYDAAKGITLLGDGTGGFEALPIAKSGFIVEGAATALSKLLLVDGRTLYIAARNDDRLTLHSLGNSISQQNVIKLGPLDTYVIFDRTDGTQWKQEVYRGGGYLSQSSRYIYIPPTATTATIYNSTGDQRKIER